MAKRLTEIQKKVIINDFVNGLTIDQLSIKFSCTKPTIVRNLKKNLSTSKYNSILKQNKTSQINLSKTTNVPDKLVSDNRENNNLINENKNLLENRSKKINNYDAYSDTTFMEIVPLDYDINRLLLLTIFHKNLRRKLSFG